ncbi:MAG: hypothetical protein KKB05_00620 [Proteobacteria bacterium]|nr:hypothetical protein [Pseudomonadota bacterium]
MQILSSIINKRPHSSYLGTVVALSLPLPLPLYFTIIPKAFIDSKTTSFVSVTIAEAMGLLELERLVSALEQAGYIKKIHSIFPSRTITKVPMFPHEVRGIGDLHKIGKILFGGRES